MPATHKVTATILFLIFSLLLAACGEIPPLPTAFVTSQAPTIIVPTLTPRPTATVTPTEVSSAMQGTPLPLPLQVLAPENSSHMLRLARWGKGIPQQIACAPDGSALVVAASGGLVFYDPSTLAETRILETQSMPRRLAFSEDSSQLAVGFQDDSRIRLYQLSDGKPAGDFNADGGTLAFSPDGRLLAVSGLQLDLWQVPDGKLLRSLSNPAPYGPLTFSVDGKLIASAGWDGRTCISGE